MFTFNIKEFKLKIYLADIWNASPSSFSLKYTGAQSNNLYPIDNASLITGFASEGDIPNVPSPILGIWNAVDAKDAKLTIFLKIKGVETKVKLKATIVWLIVVWEKHA